MFIAVSGVCGMIGEGGAAEIYRLPTASLADSVAGLPLKSLDFTGVVSSPAVV